MRRGHGQALRAFERELRRLGRAPGTAKNHLREADRFLRDTDKPLSRLKRADVRRHLAALSDLGVAASTQARVLGALRSFGRALVAAGHLREDPTEGLRVKRGEPSPRLLLSVAQVRRLLGAALEHGPGRSSALALRDRALLELLYGLGLRRSEASAARTADLNLADGSLLVRRAKGGVSRVLPLPRAALPHLRAYTGEGRPRLVRLHDPGALLVTKTGRALTPDVVGRVVGRAARRAGIAGCHPHALRRAVASHLVAAGVSVRAVQILLGHRDLQSTQLYVEVDRRKLHRVVALLERQAVSFGSRSLTTVREVRFRPNTAIQ